MESLIDKAYKAKLRKEQKPGRAKQTLQMDRHQTLEEIRALMTEDTSRPDDSGVTSQTLPEASMDAPRSLERPPLVADTADSPDEKNAEPSPEPAAVQANETSLDQGGANCALPDSLHDSQVPAATADEDRPKQTALEDSSPKPNDAPPLTQSNAPLPAMKIKPQKKKTFTVPSALLPKVWDTDQSD